MELLDIYDNNGNKTGRTIIRGDKSVVLNDNEYIGVAVIFIENSEGKFLIQKTSKEKGGFFASTGGHINSGDNALSTIKREVKEELGIDISKEPIEDYGFLLHNKILIYLFYIKKEIDIKDLVIQKEEVDYVQYMSVDEIRDLIENDKMLRSHVMLFNEIMNKKHNDKYIDCKY